MRRPRFRKDRPPVEDPDGSLSPGSELGWPDVPQAAFWTDRTWWRRAGSASIAIWAAAGVALITGIVAARALGPDGYGSVVLAIAVVTLISTLLDLTLEQGVVHHGYRALTAKDYGALRSLLRVAFAVDLGVGLAVGALILGLAGPLSDLLGSGEADASMVRIAVAISVAQTVDGTTGAVLLLAGRRELRAWVMFGTSVLRLVGVVWAVGVGGPQEVLVAYAGAALAGSLIQGGIAWRVGWSKWDRAEPREGAREWLGKLRSFGIFSSIATSVQGAQRSAAPVILGSLAGAQTVGIFTCGVVSAHRRQPRHRATAALVVSRTGAPGVRRRYRRSSHDHQGRDADRVGDRAAGSRRRMVPAARASAGPLLRSSSRTRLGPRASCWSRRSSTWPWPGRRRFFRQSAVPAYRPRTRWRSRSS